MPLKAKIAKTVNETPRQLLPSGLSVPADQEFLLRLHMKSGGIQRAGLGLKAGAELVRADEGLVLRRRGLEKWMVR